jgi:UPF0716 protein FxsA
MGGSIGITYTLLLCVLTAIIGSVLIRRQGLSTLFSAQSELNHGNFPARDIFDGVCLVISGALLLTPGFFTDTIGFMMLVPYIRNRLFVIIPKYVDTQFTGQGMFFNNSIHRNPNDIDVEFEKIEEQETDEQK